MGVAGQMQTQTLVGVEVDSTTDVSRAARQILKQKTASVEAVCEGGHSNPKPFYTLHPTSYTLHPKP